MNELKPITEPYEPEVGALLSRYPKQDGYLLSLFRVFGNSARFLRKGVANLLDRDSPLSLRERELVILRTCANTDCEYEWGVHVTIFGPVAKLDDVQISATTRSIEEMECWSEQEVLLLSCVDELCQEQVIKQNLLRFQKTWSLQQQLEILALVGNYHTISMVAKTAGLESEAFAARFPPG